jgi:two-component system, OmpR family, phosphate regulon response regulator PhoB
MTGLVPSGSCPSHGYWIVREERKDSEVRADNDRVGYGMPPIPEAPMKRVLIVEDEAPLRELWRDAIREGGFDAVAVESADDAFERLDTLHADLIVLDLLMPPMQMSGLELLARLHENPRWRDVPVIITSAIGQALDRQTAASLGARQILAKPLRSAELLAAIRSVIATAA